VRFALVLPPTTLQPPLSRPRHAPHYTAIAAAALRDAGHDVVLQDQTLRTCALERVVEDAVAARADVVLLVHNDYNREFSAEVLQGCAEALVAAGLDVVGLGRLSRDAAQTAMERIPALPGLLFGEPEFSAVAFANDRAAGGDGRVPGSRWRDGAEVPQAEVDLDDSPVPAWDLVDMERYGFSPHQQAGDLVYPILASRGCPYPCFWCEVRVRPNWATRSVDAVIDELNELHRRWGVTSVFVADPTFAIDRDWALEFCRRLPAEGPAGLRWSCMSRTDRVDLELLRSMKAAGCWSVLFGIESLNGEALAQSRKNLDPDTVGPAVAAAKAAGLETIVSVMIGLPGDSPRGFERTLSGLISMEPDFAQFFVVQIAKDEAPRGGRTLSDWDGSRFDFWGHVWAADAFESKEQLLALRRSAFRRFYLRPKYVGGRLSALLRSGEVGAQLARAARGGVLALRLARGERM
jgi:radical SAM superfamily enzyme YgiQ (UPF0313 family)